MGKILRRSYPMTFRFFFPAAFFLLLLLMSCAGPPARMPAEEAPQPLQQPQVSDYVPKKAYALGFIPAWESALQSLRETNIPLTIQDRDKGIIRTDYIKGAEIRRLEKAFSTRYKYNIFLFRESEKRTVLNVRCLYEIKEKSGQSFGNANDLYPDEVIVLEKELYRILESTLSRAEASRPLSQKAEEKEKAPAPQAQSPTASWPVFPPEAVRGKEPSSAPPASAPAIPEASKPRGTPPVSSREAQTSPPPGKEVAPGPPRPEQTAKAVPPKTKIFLVTKKNANLREKPSTQSKTILTLKPGRKVEKIGESGNWVQIRIWETTTGWVLKDLLQEAPP
jgi:hypothetical protein